MDMRTIADIDAAIAEFRQRQDEIRKSKDNRDQFCDVIEPLIRSIVSLRPEFSYLADRMLDGFYESLRDDDYDDECDIEDIENEIARLEITRTSMSDKQSTCAKIVYTQRGVAERPVRAITYSCPKCGVIVGIPLDDNETPDEYQCLYCGSAGDLIIIN